MPLRKLQGSRRDIGTFVIGNGNTFENQDLTALEHRNTICVNRSPGGFDPKFWIFMDPKQDVLDAMKDSKGIKICRHTAKGGYEYADDIRRVKVRNGIAKAKGVWSGYLAMGNTTTVAALHLA